jgi:pyridoxamine 5'-phosphate oxidase
MTTGERSLVWAELERATRDRDHPFRQPVVLSVDEAGYPCGRVLTLRAAEPASRSLRFHIDTRSPKFSHWSRQPLVSAVFYDQQARWQLRVRGAAILHHQDDIARAAWLASHPMCQRTYLAQSPPGLEIDWDSPVFPPGLERRRPTQEEAEAGYPNFAVLLITVAELDSLHLSGDGHRRFRIEEADHSIRRLAP